MTSVIASSLATRHSSLIPYIDVLFSEPRDEDVDAFSCCDHGDDHIFGRDGCLDDVRLIQFHGLFDSGGEFFRRGDMFAGKTEGAGIFHEVYIRWKVAGHIAFLVSGLLQLANHAEAAVIEDDDDHRDMIGGEGEEFAARHLESAVAGYEKDGFFRFRQLCAHSSRQSESHGTEDRLR